MLLPNPGIHEGLTGALKRGGQEGYSIWENPCDFQRTRGHVWTDCHIASQGDTELLFGCCLCTCFFPSAFVTWSTDGPTLDSTQKEEVLCQLQKIVLANLKSSSFTQWPELNS